MHFFVAICFDIVPTEYIESDKKQNASNVGSSKCFSVHSTDRWNALSTKTKKLLDYRTTKCKTEYRRSGNMVRIAHTKDKTESAKRWV